jgi:hypothetical protein
LQGQAALADGQQKKEKQSTLEQDYIKYSFHIFYKTQADACIS